MKCPFCTKTDTQVLESRVVEDGIGMRRRRECKSCKKRFTTIEKVKGSVLWVIKKDGRRELFEKEKLRRGVLRAIEKRPVSIDLVNQTIDDLERELLSQEKEEIPTQLIGKLVLKKLKKIDKE
ncbi:transcriptional regulator NrdR, partial [Patescibacteria group bacterium]|nr:transcriptional regulator NrdR [Patescibacteria group bacterium]